MTDLDALRRGPPQMGDAAIEPAPADAGAALWRWIERARIALQIELEVLLASHCPREPDGSHRLGALDPAARAAADRLMALIAEAPHPPVREG